MTLYDSHAHFEEGDDISALFARAHAAGVKHILAVGGNEELNRTALRTPAPVALGFDRDELARAKDVPQLLRALYQAHRARCVAIGEIGLDCHYDPETIQAQCALVAEQLAFADEVRLPVVIHTREADEATLGVLDEVPWHETGHLRGVIHSFVGSVQMARELLDRAFALSFSGIVTFRSADLVRASARYVPSDRLLIETDAPFLAPVPLRGKRCESAFLVETAKCVARERQVSLEEIARVTTENARKLFASSPQK